MDDKKKERERIKRLTKGTPGLYVQNQKAQVFEDSRTKRLRTRSEQRRVAIQEGVEPPVFQNDSERLED
jgi:hypothetical protein